MNRISDEVRVNNAQRQALVTLAERRFEELISLARDENGLLVAEITDDVRNKLGLPALNAEIEQLTNKVNLLKKTREKLGFTEWGSVIEGSKARLLVEKRTKDEDRRIRQLRKGRDDLLGKLWLARTIAEAKTLMGKVPSQLTKTKILKGGEKDGK